MFDGLLHLFDTEGFPARWFCGPAWAEEPIVGWLHIVSDLVTFASYFAVPGVVAFYVTRKKDLDFPPIFWIFFGLIFFSCGSVHLVEAGIFWWPAYRLSALLKVITAVVSSIGVVVLARSLPRALDLKTPEQLDAEITERRDAQAKLAFETNLLHTLMNHLPDAIYFKDQSGKYLRVSRALADKLKLSDVAEATGKSESDFLADAAARDVQQDDQSVLNDDITIVGRIEKEPWSDASDEKWVSTTRLPLRDSRGEVIGTFGISHDVTEIKQARDDANAANRAKSEFLANMSHEIRTPMNAILGMTELVLGDEIPDQDREYLNTVLESGESLLSIINEILDFSKIEAGRIELDPSVMDIREVMGDMVKPLAVRAHRKQIELACEIAAEVPQFVVADVARLRQIIVNLVGNAIKFTDDGEVVVSLGIDPSDDAVNDASVALKFCVSDTGVGIPAHQLDSIFDAFGQGDTSTTRRFGGTGLGLAISTDLVRLMGGEINVESEVDSGSQFSFTLRLPKGDPPTDRVEPRPDQVAGMHVLVVDDNDTNRHILDKMLTSWGMKPIATPDADAALRVLRQRQASGHPVEVVVTDVHMPGKDGFQLVEELNNTESIADTPVIILTSGAGRDDARRCQQLRVVAHLMKPVKQSELLDALLLTVTDGRATNAVAPAADTVDTSAQRPLHVLLVEDGLANQKLAIGLLERWGHQVETAENGAIAVDLCSSRSFDLILMDLQMPVMDGIEATRRIRAAESGTSLRVPIIAMTAHALVGDRQRCIDAGMDDYVSKPIRQKELYRAIGSITAPKAPPAVTEASQPDSTAGPPPAHRDQAPAHRDQAPAHRDQAPAHRDQDGPLNLDQVLEVMDQDRGILVSVIQAFIDESPELLEQMEQALRQNDPAMLERAAHTLKGNYMILRQDGLQSLSGQVEELAQQQRLDEARRPVDQLRTNTIAIVGQLREYVSGD